MDCVDARHLIDQGVVPGSTRGRNLQLGFHLAQCADCRAYRDHQLLSALVSTSAGAVPLSVAPTPDTTHVTPSVILASIVEPAVPAARRQRNVKRFVILAVGLLALLLAVSLSYIGLPVYRAYDALRSSYQAPTPIEGDTIVAAVPPSTLSSTTTPTITTLPTSTSLPTSTATATVTPEPTITPTVAPTATAVPTPTPNLPEVRPVTIALVGLDARPGEGLLARSDALMLVRLDPASGTVSLLSMPRDMWVAIPGYGESKINAAFYHGERSQRGGGMTLTEQTLSRAFDVQIDHTVVIDFDGFRSLVDALGGITVDVPKEIYDDQFPTDDYGYTVAHFLAGPQHMDGARALMYARTRHPDSDFERIKRQQLVLLGIARRLQERGLLQNLHEADKIVKTLTPFVHTNMPPDLVLSLLWNIRNVDPSNVHRYTVDGSMLWETSVNGAYALVPQDGVLKSMGQKLLAPTAP